MKEVSGPIVAIALVLCAVVSFVPMAFLTGVTGTFYKQFAVNHRDLDGDLGDQLVDLVAGARCQACCTRTARPRNAISRGIERAFGWVFGPFNRFFKASSDKYHGSVSRILKRRGVAFAVYAVLLVGHGSDVSTTCRAALSRPRTNST